MSKHSETLDAELRKLPLLFLEEQIRRKLAANGIPSSEKIAKFLVERAQSGTDEPLVIEGESPDLIEKIELTFSENDLREIKDRLDSFLKCELPEIIKASLQETASEVLSDLEKQWPEQSAWEEAIQAGFRTRLMARWGRSLTWLRILLAMSREIGSETSKRYRKSRSKQHRFTRDALIRLHARSCQVTAEIVVLLENGFADGAMARWRTLYEISVVTLLISEHGEDLAERYIAHQIVETKRALDGYSRALPDLGYRAISKRRAKYTQDQYSLVIQKYGTSFGETYGWATNLLKKRKPTFSDLEAAARRSKMRPFYKLASYNVHASSKGIYYKLGDLDGATAVAGASNAGLTEPGQNTAISLTAISTCLVGLPPKVEEVVAMQTMALVREKAVSEFIRAGRRLKRDHNTMRVGRGRNASTRSKQA